MAQLIDIFQFAGSSNTLSPPSTTFGWMDTASPAARASGRSRALVRGLHTGAHIDSPLHVFKDGITMAEISSIRSSARPFHPLPFVGANHIITIDDLERGGADKVKKRDIVLLRTDWTDKMYGKILYYFTQLPRSSFVVGQWLVAKDPKSIGFDFFEEYCARLPYFTSEDFPMHRVILGAGIVIKGITNLGALPRQRVPFDVLFYKIEGTQGAPARILRDDRLNPDSAVAIDAKSEAQPFRSESCLCL